MKPFADLSRVLEPLNGFPPCVLSLFGVRMVGCRHQEIGDRKKEKEMQEREREREREREVTNFETLKRTIGGEDHSQFRIDSVFSFIIWCCDLVVCLW